MLGLAETYNQNWQIISNLLNRSMDSCIQKYRRSIDTNEGKKRIPWTKEEDEIIIFHLDKLGKKW